MAEATQELLDFAIQVARNLWDDPEAESAAGSALLRAVRTYNGTTSLKGWVSYCVKMSVRDWWRRFHYTSGRMQKTVQHKADVFWLKIKAPKGDEVEEFQEKYPFYWTLLVERFLEKLPVDVIARQRNTTMTAVRSNIEKGIELLREYSISM